MSTSCPLTTEMPLPAYLTQDVCAPTQKAVLELSRQSIPARSVRLVGRTLVIEDPSAPSRNALAELVRSVRLSGLSAEFHVHEINGDLVSELIRRGFAVAANVNENERMGAHTVLRLCPVSKEY